MDDLSAPSPWQATRFEIRTRLEPLDFLHLMTVVRWSAIERIVSWLSIVGAAAIGAIASIALEPLIGRLPVYAYWDWGLAFTIAGGLVGALIYKVFVMGPYVDSMFYGQPVGMGETTIVADTRGVDATCVGIATQIPWNKFQDVIVTNEHLFLMYGRIVGLIVPRRAFANNDEAQRFAEFVRSKTQKPG